MFVGYVNNPNNADWGNVTFCLRLTMKIPILTAILCIW